MSAISPSVPLTVVAPSRPLSALREALATGALSAVLSTLLLWLGPPGSDLAAHAYQRWVFLEHGMSLWNNFWYSGRYSFVTYSVAYYPLAAALGIAVLAVLSISTASFAFTLLVRRQWGPVARWSSWAFAVVWTWIVFSAAFPFALGVALALLALLALQSRREGWFAATVALVLAASPLAFLLLLVVLCGIGVLHLVERSPVAVPALSVAATATVGMLLWRLFPAGGHFPFSLEEAVAASTFCVVGIALSWRVASARPLLYFFLVYLAACLVAFGLPSAVGENIARVRYAAIPIAILVLSLRRWRPLPLALAALLLASMWNVTPLAASFAHGIRDGSASATYWQPAVNYLGRHLGPNYRVEAVDTADHWEALYLPRAGIPLARGWFRQDDFPQNSVLYDEMGAHVYLAWLRRLGVRYVVLSRAPPDYSARAEATLLRSGRSGLKPVFSTAELSIYAVPSPRPLLTGPGRPRVLAFTQSGVTIALSRPGRYRLAVRYSPYWRGFNGCMTRADDGMMQLVARSPGVSELKFRITARGAAGAFAKKHPMVCWEPDWLLDPRG
jgi:hypothetical protein